MDQIDQIRAFNRFYTSQSGLLERSYLGSGQTLSEVRVLFELAAGGGALTARTLAGRLGLDEGYLSRLLARYAARGWLARRPVAGDGRQRALGLTEAGEAALAPLIERSRAAVQALIAPIGTDARDRLLAAMAEVETLLAPTMVTALEDIQLSDLHSGDLGWLIEAHGRLYARDESFDMRFEALVAEVAGAFVRTRGPRDRAWIAHRGAQRLGSLFVVALDAHNAKLRLFLLEPEARGQGLAQRMLDALIAHCRDHAFTRIELWTHESHRAACALYARNGFTLTDSQPSHSFGQDVVEQQWELTL